MLIHLKRYLRRMWMFVRLWTGWTKIWTSLWTGLRTSVDQFRPVKTSSDQTRPLWSYLDQFEIVKTDLSMIYASYVLVLEPKTGLKTGRLYIENLTIYRPRVLGTKNIFFGTRYTSPIYREPYYI